MRPWFVLPIVLICALPIAVIGCTPKQAPAKADLRATDTPGRVPALVNAAKQNDDYTLGELIHALGDEDPAIRLFAIQALNKRTGQTHGYRYYDPESHRREAITRWHKWLAERAETDPAATADANP